MPQASPFGAHLSERSANAKLCELSALPQARVQHGHGTSSARRLWTGSRATLRGGLSQGRSPLGSPTRAAARPCPPAQPRSFSLSCPRPRRRPSLLSPRGPLSCSALPAAPALLPGRRLTQLRAHSDLLALLSAIQQALTASPIPALVGQLPR